MSCNVKHVKPATVTDSRSASFTSTIHMRKRDNHVKSDYTQTWTCSRTHSPMDHLSISFTSAQCTALSLILVIILAKPLYFWDWELFVTLFCLLDLYFLDLLSISLFVIYLACLPDSDFGYTFDVCFCSWWPLPVWLCLYLSFLDLYYCIYTFVDFYLAFASTLYLPFWQHTDKYKHNVLQFAKGCSEFFFVFLCIEVSI